MAETRGSNDSAREMDNDDENTDFFEALMELAEEKDSDVFVISGDIDRTLSDRLIETIESINSKRTNVVVFLCTFGGIPDSAYIIAKTFKRVYRKFELYISGYCKSAGTIIALGANEIAMSTKGELGPLDVQLPKEDSLFSQTSGLDSAKSIDVLQSEAVNVFDAIFVHLLRASRGRFTTRTAANIATELVVGMLAPIAGQVDPLRLAENQRALDIAHKYGTQLGANPESIKRLIYDYPSHSHVIDLDEAKEVFGEGVKGYTELETKVEFEIQSVMKIVTDQECIRLPHEDGLVLHLNSLWDANKDNGESESGDQNETDNSQHETDENGSEMEA